jgi:hypothetical protein
MPLYGARNTSVTVPSLRNKPDARAGVILCGTQQTGNVDAVVGEWSRAVAPQGPNEGTDGSCGSHQWQFKTLCYAAAAAISCYDRRWRPQSARSGARGGDRP